LSVVGVSLQGRISEQAVLALAAYGAVIISFLGGIHWGMAIADLRGSQTVSTFNRRLGISVIPALAGWGALFLPPPYGFLILAAAFVSILFFDVQATRKSEAPAWYPRLRWPLTAVVATSLLLGAFA
jgi:hypothetical protein